MGLVGGPRSLETLPPRELWDLSLFDFFFGHYEVISLLLKLPLLMIIYLTTGPKVMSPSYYGLKSLKFINPIDLYSFYAISCCICYFWNTTTKYRTYRRKKFIWAYSFRELESMMAKQKHESRSRKLEQQTPSRECKLEMVCDFWNLRPHPQ